VASLPNLKDLWQRKALPIERSGWCERKCNLLHLEGVFCAKGRVMASDPREAILDDNFGHDHVDLTIFYYIGNILTIMTIWKWPLA
jgi:hypothetical protein